MIVIFEVILVVVVVLLLLLLLLLVGRASVGYLARGKFAPLPFCTELSGQARAPRARAGHY